MSRAIRTRKKNKKRERDKESEQSKRGRPRGPPWPIYLQARRNSNSRELQAEVACILWIVGGVVATTSSGLQMLQLD